MWCLTAASALGQRVSEWPEEAQLASIATYRAFVAQRKTNVCIVRTAAISHFHEDTNPSLFVTLEARGDAKENNWHCFGCKESWSIIDFVALMTGETLRDGANLVAEVSSCDLAPAKSKKRQKPQEGRREAGKQQTGKSRPLVKKRR